MSYIFISCFSLIMSYFFFSKITDMKISRINFISFIFYFIMIFEMSIGTLLIILMIDNHYIISKIGSLETRRLGYYYVNLFIISFPVIILFFSKILNFNIKKINNDCNIKNIKILSVKSNDKEVYYICYFFLFVGILSAIYSFYCIKTIPILSIIFNNDPTLRIKISRHFPGNIYIKNCIFYVIPHLFTFITYIYWKKFNSKKWKILFFSFFILNFLSKTYNLEKSSFIIFLLDFYLLKILLFKNIKLKTLFLIIISIITIIAIFYIFNGNISNLLKYNSGPIGRIILSQIAGFYASLEIFPKTHDYLRSNFSIRSARLIMAILNPKGVTTGTAGVMNSLFLAEAYAHFSKIGLYFSLIYVPFIFSIFLKVISTLKKTPMIVAVYSYLGFSYFANNITGGIIAYIYSSHIIIIIIYLCSVYIIYYILKLYHKNNKIQRGKNEDHIK